MTVEQIAKEVESKPNTIYKRLSEMVELNMIIRKYPAGQQNQEYMLSAEKKKVTDDERREYESQIWDLKDELKKLNAKYNTSHRQNRYEDGMLSAMKDYLPRLSAPLPIQMHDPADNVINESAVLMLSDMHFWDQITLEHTGGLSEYNMDIACEYMHSLAKSIIHILQTNHSKTKFDALYIFMLGDMIAGIIHRLMEHAPATVISAKLEAGLLISIFLRDLRQYFPVLINSCVVGNHPRLTKDKSYKWRAEENFDWDIYNQCAISLQNVDGISFNIPTSFWMLQKIYDWHFLLLHGDDINSWNQVPWYGILRALRNMQELLHSQKLDYDYGCLGHFHNAGTLDRCRGEIILNGSGSGMSDFSIGKLFTGNVPKQMFFGVHEFKGVSWRYPIVLERCEEQSDVYKIDRSVPIHEAIINALAG